MEEGGWVTGYTDGSAKLHSHLGLVGGYVACIPITSFELSGYLPVDESQTNNRAYLMAAIALLGSLPRHIMKILFATYSDYLRSGIQGPVYKRQTGIWCTQKGLVPNADLWERLLQLISASHALLQWIWGPSHVEVRGNERADALAKYGRKSSALVVSPAPLPPGTPLPPQDRPAHT